MARRAAGPCGRVAHRSGRRVRSRPGANGSGKTTLLRGHRGSADAGAGCRRVGRPCDTHAARRLVRHHQLPRTQRRAQAGIDGPEISPSMRACDGEFAMAKSTRPRAKSASRTHTISRRFPVRRPAAKAGDGACHARGSPFWILDEPYTNLDSAWRRTGRRPDRPSPRRWRGGTWSQRTSRRRSRTTCRGAWNSPHEPHRHSRRGLARVPSRPPAGTSPLGPGCAAAHLLRDDHDLVSARPRPGAG